MDIVQLPLDFDTPKLCECGCGQPTRIADSTNASRGWIKGQPIRFIHHHQKIQPPIERFWSKVNKTDDPSQCWLWQSAFDQDGYGLFKVNSRMVRAPRYMYQLVKGAIPLGYHVMHSCDNPPCVNPNHLSVGTGKDNHHDSSLKGRRHNQQGALNNCAKLTSDAIVKIRQLHGQGLSNKEIAKRFHVSRSNIGFICARQTWRHIP